MLNCTTWRRVGGRRFDFFATDAEIARCLHAALLPRFAPYTLLAVTRTAFGALPIQRVNFDVAREILHRAVDGGINFIDTARAYSDSEAKLGYALGDRWDGIVLATKAHARTGEAVLESIETSLANLKRDVIDVIQLHNPDDSFDVDAPDDRYDALLKAKQQGKVRHLGITLHKIGLACNAHKARHRTCSMPGFVIDPGAASYCGNQLTVGLGTYSARQRFR